MPRTDRPLPRSDSCCSPARDRRRSRTPRRSAGPTPGRTPLTGARLSEIINLKWDEIGELTEDGASARLEDSKTGPRTIWLGPEAASLLATLPRPEGRKRVFPQDLTSDKLYTFWVGIREEAALPGLRIHDCRHTWASQGVMNGVGLTTIGRLLGHRQRETTASYAHLDDAALREAAGQVAVVRSPAPWDSEPSRCRCRKMQSTTTHLLSCPSSPDQAGQRHAPMYELRCGSAPGAPSGRLERRRRAARENPPNSARSTG
ncbi:MAG: tyrosine-type recombinase/integrase [Gammaproteobacteria bacterium]|nr:tyrosine-type recombinase/integrase [Gammaproteobacteria bacterium]